MQRHPSQRLGLPVEIIESARAHISKENTQFEDVVSQLEATRQELELIESNRTVSPRFNGREGV